MVTVVRTEKKKGRDFELDVYNESTIKLRHLRQVQQASDPLYKACNALWP